MATALAGSLPPEMAGRVPKVANAGFVDASGIGFLLSEALRVVPMTRAAMLLPGRARAGVVTQEIRPLETAGDETALAA